MTMLRADDISKTIATFAKERQVNLIVLGESSNARENKFFKRLRTLLKDTSIALEVIPQ